MTSIPVEILLIVCIWSSLSVDGFLIRSPPQRLSDGSEEFTISFRLPNITLVNDNVFLCVVVEVPETGNASIVGITPAPMVGVKNFLFLEVCDSTPIQVVNKTGISEVFDCGPDTGGRPNPPLVRSPACLLNGGLSQGYSTYQYNGGSVQEGSLVLPHDAGIPIRGPGIHKAVVLAAHFPKRPANHMTGSSGLDVRIVRNRPNIQSVRTLDLAAFGFVDRQTVGRVSGSWTMKRNTSVRILRLFTHCHDLGIGIEVGIKRQGEQEMDVILSQDPRSFSGITNMTDSPSAVMQQGDRLLLSCLFNNSMPSKLRVWDREMCAAVVYLQVTGDQELETSVVSSMDPRFSRCFAGPHNRGLEVNDEGISSITAVVTDDECPSPSLPKP